MVGVGKGAEMGVLIKNAEVLEKLERVNTLVIDKTGTLTEGKPKIDHIHTTANWQENAILQVAASLEALSEHPIGLSILQEAKKRALPLSSVNAFQAVTGFGVKGFIDEKEILVGTAEFLKEMHSKGIEELQNSVKEALTVIFIAIQGQAVGYITVKDPIKASTPKAIEDLHRLGVKVIMLTGDNIETAQSVATKLQIDEVYAGVNPLDKQAFIQKHKSEKKVIAMAGDGMNDAAALATADVGIAMGTGSDVAIESAGVTLVKGDLNGAVLAFHLSRNTMRNIHQNLFFAFIYNLLGLPIAAGALYPVFGLLLNPMIASVAMTLSSLSVIFNALRLKSIKVR